MIVKRIKPFMVQFGAALAVSFAGFLYTRFRNKRIKPSLPTLAIPSSDHGSETEAESRGGGGPVHRDRLDAYVSGDTQIQKTTMDNDSSVQEFGMPVCKESEIPRSDSFAPLAFPSQEEVDCEKEIRQLRKMVRGLQESERNLEAKLLEFYSLKEQQKVAMELRNRLKLNQMETKIFNLKIESLQTENRRLNAQVTDHDKVVAELEVARSQIKLLKKTLWTEAQPNKEQILYLQERVAKSQEQQLKALVTDPDNETMMRRSKDLEAEVDDLRKSNARLKFENSELAERIESTQILANSKLEDSEVEVLNEECNRLRHENEHLKRKIEQLQAHRCTDLEELVYLKWINACLRFELRNHQAPPGKALARDLSKTLTPKSEERAKQLILEYARTEGFNDEGLNTMDFDYDWWSSSQDSFITVSGHLDDSSMGTSLASKTHKSVKKSHLLGKLRKLMHGKDAHHDNRHEKVASPDHWDSPGCSLGTGVHTIPKSHNNKFVTPRLNFRHFMDFHLLMRNKVDESSKDVGSDSHQKCDIDSCVYRTLVLGEDQMPMKSESTGKTELIKFAEALKNSHSPKKMHKKSASYCFGET